MLQSSLKEALREADSGKPQAASTYISNCSMPEARMEAKSCIKRWVCLKIGYIPNEIAI